MTGDRYLEYDFLGQLSVVTKIEDFERLVVPYCESAFSALNAVAVWCHLNGPPETLFRWVPDAKACTVYDQYYDKLGFMLDPYMQLAFETKSWAVCPLRDIAPDRFETSDYFLNYFGATKMVDELGFVARVDPHNAVHFSIGRCVGQRRFRSTEIQNFKNISRILIPKLMSIVMKPEYVLRDGTVEAVPLERRFAILSKAIGNSISAREAEVAALIVKGHSSRAIGLKLDISVQTVKVHRRNLYAKLEISSQSELIKLLTEHIGLLNFR